MRDNLIFYKKGFSQIEIISIYLNLRMIKIHTTTTAVRLNNNDSVIKESSLPLVLP